jgi:hypothetical protein
MSNEPEIECFGLDYERFELEYTLKRLVKKYGIRSAAEIPAVGVKAMPSIYSIGLGLSGCKVTLVNGEKKSLSVWDKLGMLDLVEIYQCDEIHNTGLDSDKYDFVWNFASFSTLDRKENVAQEMIRISKKYVAIFSPNCYNPGYLSHRTAHRLAKIPWSHGDVNFYSPRSTTSFLRSQGLKIVDLGVFDTPPWPDSIGFRDIRLHKMQDELHHVQWRSRYIDYLSNNKYPGWIKALHAFERIPVPLHLKFFYAHLFYVVGEK